MSILPIESQENQLLQAALRYARCGWRVLPLQTVLNGACSCGKAGCDRPGKHPRTRHGSKDATTDEATIRGWWAAWPSANVGIATGLDSGLFMVGPDGHEGVAALAELERQHGPLPVTAKACSGSGTGKHYYYAWPADGNVKNRENHRGLPIDVRGAGGFVVAPPSAHKSGERYSWELPPWEVPVAEAPAWLLDWVRQDKDSRNRKKGNEGTKETNQLGPAAGIDSFVRPEVATENKVVFAVQPDGGADVPARALAYLAKCPSAISGQGGHSQTFEVARAVVYGFDLGADAGFDLLWEHYNPKCSPPWSEAELRHKCEEADTQPFDKPRGYLLHAEVDPDPASDPPRGSVGDPDDIEYLPMPQPAPWPTLPPAALQGLAGEIVRAIEPQTESDPVAILGQLLVAFGNAIGRKPYYPVEGDKHYPNLFLNTVGKSSHGRKGTSWGRVRQILELGDADWLQKCVRSGLASGEGLLYFVRDAVEKEHADGQVEVLDEGAEDKRLLVMEGEFAQVLRVLKREGNTLSVFIRQAWDTGTLTTLTRNSPLRATGAHICVVGHITVQELAKYLDQTELFNGFANRFLWLLARRSKLLPDGGRDLDLSPLGVRLAHALAAARTVGPMTRGKAASRLWHQVYPQLTAERTGLYGAVTGRAEAQVLRLSMVYALLDGKCIIEEEHLQGALALWSYADTSARLIFGAEAEDPLVGLVLAKLLEAGPVGMTRTNLHNAFNRNMPADSLVAALAKLRDRGDAYSDKVKTGKPGAPAERWFAGRKTEGNESTWVTGPDPGRQGIDSVNSFVRSPSVGDTTAHEKGVMP
jgi:hypothetical protein